MDDYSVETDFETGETVFTITEGGAQFRGWWPSGAEALKAFQAWRKANNL